MWVTRDLLDHWPSCPPRDCLASGLGCRRVPSNLDTGNGPVALTRNWLQLHGEIEKERR